MTCFRNAMFVALLAGVFHGVLPNTVNSAEPSPDLTSRPKLQTFTPPSEFFPILPWDAYLQMINRQLRTVDPIMNRLNTTGVLFRSPVPVKSLPLLPGRIVKQVSSKASFHASDVNSPIMVKEFTDQRGKDCAMIVNLSLDNSVLVKLETVKPYKTKQIVAAVDGRLIPLDEQEGHWLVAGQGILVYLQRFRPRILL